MVRRPRRQLPRRLLRILALARRADRRRRGGRDRLRRLGRPGSRPGLLRAHALPRRRGRRRLRLPGSSPLLRLLRGDADPHLRARRRLGWPEPDLGDGHVRDLHDGGLAPDARLDRRLRALAGHVQPDRRGHERQRLGLPRLPRRVRGEGAAAPVPRLAPHGLHRGAARGGRAPLRRRLQGRRLRARLDRAAALPGPGGRLAHRRARARRGRARLRLAARVPAAGRPRCDRVLVDGSDEPDRARNLRRERSRPRRRDPPLGQPRPRFGGDVPARRDADPANRHRPLRRSRRAREGTPGARHDRDGRRDADPRRARLGQLRRRVRDPRRRLRAGLGLRRRRCRRDRARRHVHAPADLGSAPPGPRRGRARGVARPAARRARPRRAARRDPARPVGVAGGDQRAVVPGLTARTRPPRRRRNDRRRVDRHPQGRLARALAGARAPRRRRDLPARRRSRPRDGPSRLLGYGRRRRLSRRRGAGRRPLRPLPRAAAADRRVDDARPARRADPDPGRRIRDARRPRLVGRSPP